MGGVSLKDVNERVSMETHGLEAVLFSPFIESAPWAEMLNFFPACENEFKLTESTLLSIGDSL